MNIFIKSLRNIFDRIYLVVTGHKQTRGIELRNKGGDQVQGVTSISSNRIFGSSQSTLVRFITTAVVLLMPIGVARAVWTSQNTDGTKTDINVSAETSSTPAATPSTEPQPSQLPADSLSAQTQTETQSQSQNVQTTVTVNGKTVTVPANGTYTETVTQPEGGGTQVKVENKQSGSTRSFNSSSLNVQSFSNSSNANFNNTFRSGTPVP